MTWFWRDENQSYMIAKVAESQGLRRLCACDEFQGLFVHEEILDVTQNAPDAEAEPRKVLCRARAQDHGKRAQSGSLPRVRT